MVHQGTVEQDDEPSNWDNTIWYINEPIEDITQLGNEPFTGPRALKLILGLISQNRDLARSQAAKDAEERKRLWVMLKWTRRIAIGALTGAAAWATTNLLPALLKFLGV